MLAAFNISKYPYFDRSEIIAEPDFLFKTYQPLKPIKAGNILPDFTLEKENWRWQQFLNGVEVHHPALLHQLLNKPLVIGFYSNQWQSYGVDLLKQLDTIQQGVKAHGGNLLIIGAERERKLEKLAEKHSLSLGFYFDTDNRIAEKFGIYSEYDPIWNKFSGIDINVPLLATYVISPSGYTVYDYIDHDFSGVFPAEDIVSAVQRAG